MGQPRSASLRIFTPSLNTVRQTSSLSLSRSPRVFVTTESTLCELQTKTRCGFSQRESSSSAYYPQCVLCVYCLCRAGCVEGLCILCSVCLHPVKFNSFSRQALVSFASQQTNNEHQPWESVIVKQLDILRSHNNSHSVWGFGRLQRRSWYFTQCSDLSAWTVVVWLFMDYWLLKFRNNEGQWDG